MRNPFLIITSLIFGSTIFISCNNILDKEKGDTTDFNVLVQTWNKAHSSKDVGVFSNIYDDKVLYYGTSLGKNFCIESKLTLLEDIDNFPKLFTSYPLGQMTTEGAIERSLSHGE